MIKCSKCNEKKDKSEFVKDKKTKTGFYVWCKDCTNAYRREWRKNNMTSERIKRKAEVDSKTYYKNHAKRRISQVEARLISRYGITLDQYSQMLEDQNGACALCFEIYMGSKAMHVDHDHVTGKVRGILCPGCNIRLGMLEKTEWVELAYAYLERVRDQ